MKFYIRPTQISDANIICNLRWDPDVVKQLNDIRQYSYKECQDWLSSLEHNTKSRRYMVFGDSGNPFIGLFRVDNIDHINNHCSVGLDICADQRGKHYSKLIYKEMLTKLFNWYNMNSIWLEVLATNTIGIKLYCELGFGLDAILRDRILRDGIYIHNMIMSITRHDFFGYHQDFERGKILK